MTSFIIIYHSNFNIYFTISSTIKMDAQKPTDQQLMDQAKAALTRLKEI